MSNGVLGRSLVPVVIGLLAWGHLTQTGFHWDCPIRTLLHFPCPTCGMTSAARAMLHLRFADATRSHPLSLVVVPFVSVLVAVELGRYVVTGRFDAFARDPQGNPRLEMTKSAVRIAGVAMCMALFIVWIASLLGAFGGLARF